MHCSTYLDNLCSLGLHNRIYINVTIRLSALYAGGSPTSQFSFFPFLNFHFICFPIFYTLVRYTQEIVGSRQLTPQLSSFFLFFFFLFIFSFFYFSLFSFIILCFYWPSSQFNKWQAQNKLLSSSLIVIGSSPRFTPPSHQRTIVAARLVL
jgi:hypothetical protein